MADDQLLTFVTTCMGRLARAAAGAGPDGRAARSARVSSWTTHVPTGPATGSRPIIRRRVWSACRVRCDSMRPRPVTSAPGRPSHWIGFVDSDVVLEPGFAAAVVPMLASGRVLPRVLGGSGLGRERSFAPGPTSSGSAATTRCTHAGARRTTTSTTPSSSPGSKHENCRRRCCDTSRTATSCGRGFTPAPTSTRPRHQPGLPDRQVGHRPARRELLTLEMRRALYDKVAEVVTAAIQSGQPGDLAVHLPAGIVPGGWSLPRQLTYRLTRDL